jgi:YHS domain-containing protein
MKREYSIMILAVLILTGSHLVRAQDAPKGVRAADEISGAKEVGNKICPVTGEKIEEQERATYEYKGKIYNFCCSGCIEEFKKDPEKYIQIIDKEMAARGTKDKEGK